MNSFEHDRDVIMSLPAQYARSVLRLMERKPTPAKTPFELRTVVAAAQRCPDVARFFLVEKMQSQVRQQASYEEATWKRPQLVRAASDNNRARCSVVSCAASSRKE